MAANPVPFPHLPLLYREGGAARSSGGGTDSQRARENKSNRTAHSEKLREGAAQVAEDWRARQRERERDGLPAIAAGVPLLLEVDPGLDLDDLRHHFQFEIVSEHEDGFVIVASDDLDLNFFLRKIRDFSGNVRGSAAIAKIHELHEDQDRRLERILSERMLAEWPRLAEGALYICDVGIECRGNFEIP